MALTDPPGEYVAQLPSELSSVGAARRLVTAAADSWGLADSVADDASLAVSELVTNSVLHARTTVTVLLRRLGAGIRIEVGDGSGHLPLVDAARPEDLLANRSMTGRGLALVAAMSDRWGADPVSAGGKVTWAEIGTGRRLVTSAPPPAFPPMPKAPALTPSAIAAGVFATSAVTGGGRTIQLIGVPVRLLIESTRQLCDLQREMQVMAMDRAGSPEVLGVIDAGRPFSNDLDRWAEADRSLAEAAMARGDERLDWNLTLPADYLDHIESFTSWLRRAVSSLVRRHLLSLPASDEVTAYRTWYRDEIRNQLSGRPPRPCPLEVPVH